MPETRSASRATLDGVQKAVAINSYLTFFIGAGQVIIGIITDLESRESYDPASGEHLTLELMKPRRIANVQLLGTIEQDANRWLFNPGITILPTLDTPAEIGAPETLKAIFETPPRRNKPDGYDGEDYDCDLSLGCPTGQPSQSVRASLQRSILATSCDCRKYRLGQVPTLFRASYSELWLPSGRQEMSPTFSFSI